MKAVITFFVFSVMFFGIHKLSNKINSDDPYKDALETYGTITKTTMSDTGNVRFYVSFVTSEGDQVEGQSIYYEKTNGKYNKGDSVRVKYNVISKDRVRVKLIDSEIVPCGATLETTSKIMLVLSVISLTIAILRVVMHYV